MRLDIGNGRSIPLDFDSIQPGDRIRHGARCLTVIRTANCEVRGPVLIARGDDGWEDTIGTLDAVVLGLANLLRKEA
jgi:hypothetical protein